VYSNLVIVSEAWLIINILLQAYRVEKLHSEGSYAGGRRQEEPTLKNVGLKQGRRISCAERLEIHLLF
jgi:hypothetical protein